MSQLVIEPNLAKKTAKVIGVIAAGEKVSVSIANADGAIASTARLRIMFFEKCVAQFPMPDSEDEWTEANGTLSCVLNLNTVQAEKITRGAKETAVFVVLDDVDEDVRQLHAVKVHQLMGWVKSPDNDVPVNLDSFPTIIDTVVAKIDEYKDDIDDKFDELEASLVSKDNTYKESVSSTLSAYQAAWAEYKSTVDAEIAAHKASVDASIASKLDKATGGTMSGRIEFADGVTYPLTIRTSDSEAETYQQNKNVVIARSYSDTDGHTVSELVSQHAPNGNVSTYFSVARKISNTLNWCSLSLAIDSLGKKTMTASASDVKFTNSSAEKFTIGNKTLAQLLAEIKTFSIEVVDALPQTGEEKKIYLVPNGTSGTNVKNEYLWVNGKWEKIGSTDIDLSPYATKDEVSEKQNLLSTAQLDAVNSGITEGKIADIDSAIASVTESVEGKQEALTNAQLAAVNSGITTEKIAQTDATLAGKASTEDVMLCEYTFTSGKFYTYRHCYKSFRWADYESAEEAMAAANANIFPYALINGAWVSVKNKSYPQTAYEYYPSSKNVGTGYVLYWIDFNDSANTKIDLTQNKPVLGTEKFVPVKSVLNAIISGAAASVHTHTKSQISDFPEIPAATTLATTTDAASTTATKITVGSSSAVIPAVVSPDSSDGFISDENKDKVPTCGAVGKFKVDALKTYSKSGTVSWSQVSCVATWTEDDRSDAIIKIVNSTDTGRIADSEVGESFPLNKKLSSGCYFYMYPSTFLVKLREASGDDTSDGFSLDSTTPLTATDTAPKAASLTPAGKQSLFSSDGFKSAIRYPDATITDGALNDYTVNKITASGTAITLTAPDKTDSKGRDFLLRLSVTAETQITWFDCETKSGETWTGLQEIESGKTYIYRFTDCGGDKLMASRVEVA